MRLMSIASATIAVPMLLAGCSNPKAASKSNFLKAIQPTVVDRFCSKLRLSSMTLASDTSAPVAAFPIILPASRPGYGGDDREDLDGWAKAGLLSRTEKVATAAEWQGTDTPKPTPVIIYAPTDAGRSAFREVDGATIDGPRRFPGACKATGRVTEVVRWSEPSSALGQTFSEVTYRYVGAEPTALATKAEIEQMARPREGKATLVKMSDGWQVAR